MKGKEDTNADEVTYLISPRPDARNSVSIGLLVIALFTGGLIGADSKARVQETPLTQQAQPEPPSPEYAYVPTAITRQHAETAALRYIFDASLELAEHIAESVRPPVPVTDPMPSLVTHYGEAFNGNVLGCGSGYYSSDNPTIVAVGPALYAQIPCGTLLQICGDGGCIVAQRQDACPGCSPVLFDLSEAAFAAVCGVPSGVCAATVSVLQTCDSLDLAWEDRPEPERQTTPLSDPPPDPHTYAEDTGATSEWECPVP